MVRPSGVVYRLRDLDGGRAAPGSSTRSAPLGCGAAARRPMGRARAGSTYCRGRSSAARFGVSVSRLSLVLYQHLRFYLVADLGRALRAPQSEV